MSDDPSYVYDVFLSHNKAQKGWTRNLARRLRDDGFKVWFDEWELPKLAGGNWIDLLVEGVEKSRKVALVWSPEFFANTWPEFEATVIQQMDPLGRQQRVIPLLHTQCEIPKKWGFRQGLDFTGHSLDGPEFEFRYHQLLYNLDNTRPFTGDFEQWRGQVSATIASHQTVRRKPHLGFLLSRVPANFTSSIIVCLLVLSILTVVFVRHSIWRTNDQTAIPASTLSSAGNSNAQFGDARIGVSLWKLRPAVDSDDRSKRIIEHPSPTRGNTPLAEFVPVRAKLGVELLPGDRIRLSVACERAAFIYVFDREAYSDDTLGQPLLIFPTMRIRGGKNEIAPGGLLEIPASEDDPPYLQVRKSRGNHVGELMMIFVTSERLPDFDNGVRPSASRFSQIESSFAPAVLFHQDAKDLSQLQGSAEASRTQSSTRLEPREEFSQLVYSVPGGASRAAIVIRMPFAKTK